MSLPTKEVNVVASHIYPVTDLAMSATLASSATSTSTSFSTGVPCTLVIVTKLTSGSGDLKIDRAAAASSVAFGSPDVTLAMSGTGYQATVLDTTTSEMFVGLKVEPGGSGIAFEKFAVLALYEGEVGEFGADVQAAINLVANTTVASKDGDGLVNLAPTKPAYAV